MSDLVKEFKGAGGPSTPPDPVQTPDNLKSEDIIEFALAVSEGPIRGLTRGAKSFMVGDTPLVSENGELNFQKFAVGIHPGYPEGSAASIAFKLGGITSSQSVGITLNQNVAVVRQTEAVLRNQIDQLEVRLNFQRLIMSNNSGTFNGTAVFNIEYKAASAVTWLNFYPTAPIEITGKTSSGAIKEFVKTVPRINEDWMIRVTKISSDSNDGDTIVSMAFESIQSTTLGAAVFPDTAIAHGLGVANGQFSSIPDFAGIYDGILCHIPTNYNPDTRTYDESVPWNGTFKFEWTNNPAWVLYEFIVNQRWGMAAYRLYIDANRFDFYEAAKWCDQEVPTGVGAETRPRYTFNDVVNTQRDGMEMLNYIAGSFNALVWDDLNGQIHLRVDKDDPAVMMFTPENVSVEGFQYTYSDIATRANDITVGFINPELDWNEDRRRIPNVTTDEEAIARLGRVPMNFVAVGCTNAIEAVCKARVRLISAQTETAVASFVTMTQGEILSLYDVILIADPIMGWSQTGRLTTFDDEWLNFRDPIYIEVVKPYNLKIQTVHGVENVSVMPEQTGLINRFHLSAPITVDMPKYAAFSLEEEGGFGFAKPFRVLSIEEVDGTPYRFRLTCSEINRTKYFDAENGTTTPEYDYSYKPPTRPGVPVALLATSGNDQLLVDNTGAVTPRIQVTWRRPFGFVIESYELQWRQENQDDWSLANVEEQVYYISNIIPQTNYNIRIRSIDPGGKRSDWLEIVHFATGKNAIPNRLVSITTIADIFEIELNWVYPDDLDIRAVEIAAGENASFVNAHFLSDIAFPATSYTHRGLNNGTRVYYWLRVRDTSGNVSPWSDVVTDITGVEPGKYLDILAGQIRETQLYSGLSSRIDLIDGVMAGSVSARISSLATTVESEFESVASQIELLQATTASSASALLAESLARADAEGALSSRIDTAQASSEAGIASAQTALTALSETDGKLAAMYTIKTELTIDGIPYMAGIGVGVENTEGITTSQILLAAQRVAIIDESSGITKVPFVYENGQILMQSLISADGVFSGRLQASNGTFTGQLDGATGTFSGRLAAGVLDFSGYEGIDYTFASRGSYSMTVPALPAGWQNLRCKMLIQAGGGSGGGAISGYYSAASGAGGGAGQFIIYDIVVTPGQILNILVGAGGASVAPVRHGFGGHYTAGGTVGNNGIASSVTISGVGAYSATPGTGGAAGWWLFNGSQEIPQQVSGGSLGGGASPAAEDYPDAFAFMGGGLGGPSRFGVGGGIAGGNGLGYGSGGGGGYLTNDAQYHHYNYTNSQASGAGADGHILLTFYDPNTVVLNNRYSALINWLNNRGLGAVPADAM